MTPPPPPLPSTAVDGRPPRPAPTTALLEGGPADAVAAQIAMLRAQQQPITDIWVLQPNHDPAVAALSAPSGGPAVQILRTDRPLGAWAPLVFAWFLPTSHALLVAPGVQLAPHFVGNAMLAFYRHRAAISPWGSRDGRPVAPGPEPQPIDAGGGAWLFETGWIRHVWRTPPTDFSTAAMPAFDAALRKVGTPALVPALPPGVASHLAP